MKLKLYILLALLVFVFFGCSKKDEQKPETNINPNAHKVMTEEVIQVTGYTYLRVKEDDKDYWIAVTGIDVKEGETLYYVNGMEMKNFESKELKRKFNSILFVDNISNKPPPAVLSTAMGVQKASPQKPVIEKENITIEPAKGGITIAHLFSNANSYADKTVKIKGKVIKINTGIMKRNWVHIQDGTSAGEDFDLTVTTNDMVNVGDVVTFEGKIALNRNFGFGYSYKVLLENAKITR